MNITTLAEKLYNAGIITKKQNLTIQNCMKGHQAESYKSTMQNNATEIEKIYTILLGYGYSKKSRYSKKLVKAIQSGIGECVKYATANNHTTPQQTANAAINNAIKKINDSIPSEGEKLNMNIKASTLEVIKVCNEALEAYLASTTAKDVIIKAQGMLKEIEAQVEAVVDISSKAAADKANEIFKNIQSAVNSYVTGNTSTRTAVTALEEAKKIAASWTTVKISRFAREARASEVMTAENINETILNKAAESEAVNKVNDVDNAITAKLDVVKTQEDQIAEMMKTRQQLTQERDGYLEKIELVKAEWISKTISSVDARQLIEGYQQNQVNVEDQIDMYSSRISQLQGAVLAQKGKLSELKIIIGNAKFFAVNSADIIVPIAENIDFDAIHAYLNGSADDIVIDKICRIDAVANIIAKKMKMSAEEAKNKLRQTRGFVSVGQQTTVTLEDKLKRSQQQTQDADDFMNSLMNGGANGPKVETPVTNPNSKNDVKITIGTDDI